MIINMIHGYYILLFQINFFGSLLDISLFNRIFLKTFNSEYDEIVVWFTDQNSKSLYIEHRVNLTMVIK